MPLCDEKPIHGCQPQSPLKNPRVCSVAAFRRAGTPGPPDAPYGVNGPPARLRPGPAGAAPLDPFTRPSPQRISRA